MAHNVPHISPTLEAETVTEREDRLAWERERIAEADADFATGRYIEGVEALDWLDRWASGEALKEPTID